MNEVLLKLTPALTLLAFIVGCAKPEHVSIEGQVFYNDKPLTHGTVVLQPAAGPPSSAAIETDGTFKILPKERNPGARIGLNKVRISARESSAKGESEIALGRLLTPERYANFESSGFTAEVKPDGNEPFVFRLTD